jgi:hypothetical protein
MLRLAVLWGALAIAFPAAAATDHLAADRATLMQWVQGSFSNERQVRDGSNALAETALDPAKAPDLLFPVFKKIEVPALVGDVIYLQWPMGTPDGKLQRQRIWVFAPDPARNAIMMKFYTLKEPEKWLNAHVEPNKVRAMTLADLIPYPPACDLPYRRHGDIFLGEIPRGECKIVSQQTKTSMTIYGRTIIAKDKLWYDESGVRDDGAIVFDVPRSGAYEFDRR